ncbi:hypothetical protein CI102_4173 [Trichoderma harzianum]|nr:hypothetical protein CI102_4173 [Trichoderma harzianum]
MIIKSGALPKELAAVKALFDEHHQCLPPLKRDTNSYCLDRIGTHNVVATCLPYKECGFKTAAKVASDIDKTFPTLERIFLVGIGGGIPSKEHNIRLSDVVVGTGIIQHDIALLPGYERPQEDRDRSFEGGFHHEEGQNTCQSCRGPEVIRESRTPRPHVHYGIIACGSQVVKDASLRDRIGTETKAICIEIEATGVITAKRCLVIRGICDYADSHKNDGLA